MKDLTPGPNHRPCAVLQDPALGPRTVILVADWLASFAPSGKFASRRFVVTVLVAIAPDDTIAA